MQDDADAPALPGVARVEIALARRGAVRTKSRGVAEDAVNVEVHEAGECETEEGAGHDEEENEVVAAVEVEGMIDLSHHTHEAVGRQALLFGHDGLRDRVVAGGGEVRKGRGPINDVGR